MTSYSQNSNAVDDEANRISFVAISAMAADCAIAVDVHRLMEEATSGRFRISARARNRFESAVLLAMAAVFSNDGARLLSFASSLRFMCEVSALWIACRRAAIRSAGRPCDRSN